MENVQTEEHGLTPQQLKMARVMFGVAKIEVPDLSGIKYNDKFFAHIKIGGEIQFVDVFARSQVYECSYWTKKGKEKVASIIEVWNFDCGNQIIDAKELRIVAY